jgi:hypothetical protein
MLTVDSEQQQKDETLTRARKLIQHILRDWDLITWDDLLANDVVLGVRMGAIGIDRIGDLAAVGGNLRVSGRQDAKRVLRIIYDDIKRGLCVTTEILSGFDVVLAGNFASESTKEGALPKSCPIVIYMKFTPNGKINVMTIALIDLQPLTNIIRNAAQTGSVKKAA